MNINVDNKIKSDTNTLTIDSVDRNWIYGDKTCDFSFRLANNVDTSLGILNKVYKNINSIELNSIIIPNFFINLDEVHCAKKIGLTTSTLTEINNRPLRFTKLSDLKYLTVKVDEIQTHQNGSNRVLNQASGVFIMDYALPKSYSNSLNYSATLRVDGPPLIKIYSDHNLINIGESNVRDNTLENIAFKNVSCVSKFIRPKDMLSSLHISFYKPDGTILELQNDTLTIDKISSTKESIVGDVSDSAFTIDISFSQILRTKEFGHNNNVVADKDIKYNKSSKTLLFVAKFEKVTELVLTAGDVLYFDFGGDIYFGTVKESKKLTTNISETIIFIDGLLLLNNPLTSLDDSVGDNTFKFLGKANTKTRVGLYITNSTFFVDNTFIISIDPQNKLTINNKSLTNSKGISLTMESRKIEIKTKEFFSSDEYRLGDRIYFKNVGVPNTNLKVFLEREVGHTIISLYAIDSSNTIITKPNYYNVIEILPKFSKNDGITFTEDYFGLQGSGSEIIPTSGKLLNLDNQIMINLNINCN